MLQHADPLLENELTNTLRTDRSLETNPLRKKFPWIRVINKHFLGYEIEDILFVGPLQRYLLFTAEYRETRMEADEIRMEPVVVQSEWSES
jgi:hypothetical protein